MSKLQIRPLVPGYDLAERVSFCLCAGIPSILFYLLGVALVGRYLASGVIASSFFYVFAFLALAIVTAVRLPMASLACGLTALSGFLVLGSTGIETGYYVFFLGRGQPLIDPVLLAVDRSLGFRWEEMLHWFNAHPDFAYGLRFSYASIDLQALFAIILLLWTGRHARASVFLGANAMTLLFVHIIAMIFPAIGSYGALGLSPADHSAIELISEAKTVAPSLALRDAVQFSLPSGHLSGLMTFPSYHSAAGILAAWALWPIIWLRVPALLLGMSVVIAALLHGSHHLADAIGGVTLALGCVHLIVLFRRRIVAMLRRIFPSGEGAISLGTRGAALVL